MKFGEPFGSRFDGIVADIYEVSYLVGGRVASDSARIRYKVDTLIRFYPKVTYKMSCRMGVPSPSYNIDAIIVLSENDPRLTESWINSFMWSYANEYHKLNVAAQLMALRMKLDYANGDDLDEHWGPILSMRRYPGEDNDSFRSRLAVRIRVLTSSGTKANCEAILDRIVDIPGASTVETYWPAEVRVVWRTDAIKIAEERSSLVDSTMNKMIASGMTWSTAYPYMDYTMDCMMSHANLANYAINGAISRKRGTTYHMYGGLWKIEEKDYLMDSLLTKIQQITYMLSTHLQKDARLSYDIKGIVAAINELSYTMDGYSQKLITSDYDYDALVEAVGLETYDMTGIKQGIWRIGYEIGGIIEHV